MEIMNELAEIRSQLIKKNPLVTFNDLMGVEYYFRNSDLEETLRGGNFSEETVSHCRRFLDARKEWGFLYTGLSMEAISQAKSWEIFSEDLLAMSEEDLTYWLKVCKKMCVLNEEIYNKSQLAA